MNIKLSENALKIFKDLYSFQGEEIKDTFKRVISEFVDKDSNPELYSIGYDLLYRGIWRPNTPTWLNAGTKHKIFSACYVVDLHDSMNSIYDIANTARKIFQYGSGVGIPIGNLREKDAFIYEENPEKVPEGKSSGPITFMKLYDAVGETTKSGGRVRRAAILCSMPVDHPDVEDFIKCKEVDGRLSNMNISVNITDKFMQALNDNVNYDLISPYENKKTGEKSAQEVWNNLVEMAWKTADPGVIFIDTVNKYNPLIKKHKIKCCNPCGEQFLPPFACCNLSAINVSKFIVDGVFNYDDLYNTAFNVMEMMDNIIDTMDYPDQRFKENTLKYRQVGIGIMGLADAMYMLDYRYDGTEGRKFAGDVMRTITTACIHKSALLAKENGPFEDYNLFKDDILRIVAEHMGLVGKGILVDAMKVLDLVKDYGLRNSQFTTCMPTGCLIDKTLVASKKGLKKIIDYKNEKFERLTTKSDFGFSHFKQYFDQGYAFTRGIITKHGYEIEGTYDHKLRVISSDGGYIWKKLQDIKIGDKVVMKKGFLIDKKSNFNDKFCELVGFYMADGWINQSGRSNRLYFSINKNEINYIKDLLNNFSGYMNFNIIEREYGDNSIKVEVNSKKFINLFKKYDCIKDGAKNAFIPQFIMNGSRNNILSFIKGYLNGDGHICKKDNVIGFTTISERIAYELQILLLGLGYPSNKIKYNQSKKELIIDERIIKNKRNFYKIVINSLYSEMLLNELNISFHIKNVKNYEKVLITPDEYRLFPENKNGYVTISKYNKLKQKNKNWFVDNNLMIEEVREVYNSIEKVHVNDLEVYENTHTYIANGFVTHNTTALSCDASYGMEPCFGLAFQKNYIDGTKSIILNPIFEERFKNEDWYTDNLPERIFNNGGSLKGLRGIPKEVREVFVVAHDINYKDRIDMQAEIQKFTSNGISSTINLPVDATVDDISYIYKYSYEKGLKGVTIYRDGSKKNQPVTFTEDKKDLTKFKRPNKISGNIYKVETGNGKMYVTIGEYSGKPVEVFIQIGKSGQIMNTFSEALGRIISLALQNGVPVDEITEKLIGINSDKTVWFRFEETDKRPSQILSAPDGLAQLLNKYYSGKKYEEELTGEICEKCGSNMSMIEGCVTCNNCGNSKCS